MTTPPPSSFGVGARKAGDHGARVERRRVAAGRVVVGFYRLVQNCALGDAASETIGQLLAPTVEAIEEYCALFDTHTVRVLFAKDQVFVNRRLLRASRESFNLALQLGARLEPFGLDEIVFEEGIGSESILAAAQLIDGAHRDAAAAARLKAGKLLGVSILRANEPNSDALVEPVPTPLADVVNAYATSILVLQSFYRQLAADMPRGAHEVKRIAQKLVALSDTDSELLIACAAAPLDDDDPARRAVSTTVIALAMTRLVTSDRETLFTATHAALMAECGAMRWGGSLEPAWLAASTLGVFCTIGEFYPTSMRPSVVAYEALRLQFGSGAVYTTGKTPTTLGLLVSVARRLNELRSPLAGRARLKLDAALRQLDSEATGSAATACVRLLISALGFFPKGTVVELDTGELAMIAGVPSLVIDFARPPVHVLTNSQKQMLANPLEVDLARQTIGSPVRSIRRPVNLDRLRAPQSTP